MSSFYLYVTPLYNVYILFLCYKYVLTCIKSMNICNFNLIIYYNFNVFNTFTSSRYWSGVSNFNENVLLYVCFALINVSICIVPCYAYCAALLYSNCQCHHDELGLLD